MGIGFWEKEEIKVHGIRILGNEWKPKEEYRREKNEQWCHFQLIISKSKSLMLNFFIKRLLNIISKYRWIWTTLFIYYK